MQNFREILEAYGVDYQSTMERFMGNEKLYLRLLDMLFQDDNLQKLGEALTCGDVAGAFEAAHTLKGVVGNMGLIPLYHSVCEIVEPLRKKERLDDYPQLYEEIRTQFKAVDLLRRQLKEGGQT